MVDDDEVAASNRRGLKLVFRAVSLVFVALCIAFVVHLLVKDWPSTSSALRHAQLWWLLPAALCAVLAVAYSSVALSVIGCYLAAAFTALVLAVAALIGGSSSTPWWPVAVVAAVGITVIHPAVSRRILALVSRAFGRALKVEIPSWGTCLRLTATYIPVWILIAAATTLVSKSLVPDPPLARVALAAVVSWIVGFITPSPGGIGVREAVFVATAGLASGPAAAVAILARVLFVLVDGSGAGVGWLVLRITEPSSVLVTTGREAI